MAKSQVILMLDSGALIAAGKNQNVESIVRRWRAEDAEFLIAAPSLAESIRGGPKDAPVNDLIKSIDHLEPTTERIARAAGTLLGEKKSAKTIDAIIVATAHQCGATDILTTDSSDIRLFADENLNIHSF